jgi:hypothetical protein
VDPLTGSGREAPEILDVCRERMLREGWDLAVCLTDLPVYRGGRLLVADVSARREVAGLSIPALGAMRLRPRAREATLQLAAELYARTRGTDPEEPPGRGPRLHEFVGSFRRVEPPDEDMRGLDVDVRFAAPGARGRLGLGAGMVLANHPWKMLPAFKHPVGFGEYVTLTSWLGTSLATVAGALGASLEDKETVREASYGYRQRRRHEDDGDES